MTLAKTTTTKPADIPKQQLIYAYWNWHATYIWDQAKKTGDGTIYVNNSEIRSNDRVLLQFPKILFNILPRVFLRLRLPLFAHFVYELHGLICIYALRNHRFKRAHLWSGFSFMFFQKMSKKCPVIIERSGTHCDVQDKLIRQECQKLKLRRPAQDLLPSWRRALMKKEYAAAANILAPADLVKESFPPEVTSKVSVIPLGYNNIGQSNGRAFEDRDVDFLLVAAPTVRKGADWFLAQIQNTKFKTLVIMSDSTFRRRLERLYGTSNSVDFIGTMPRKKLISFYEKSKYLILPSLEDGYGMVALEALSLGTMPIVSTGAGVSEVLSGYAPELIIEPRAKNHWGKFISEPFWGRQASLTKPILNDVTWGNFYADYRQL